jgi:anti-sigma B factor antagonist
VEIAERRQGDIFVLSPAGRIDNDTSAKFQEKLLATVGTTGTSVVLDLAKVEYISSAGLRALMMASKQAKATKGRIAVAALGPVVKEIFAISRFSYVVPVFDTLADAATAWR